MFAFPTTSVTVAPVLQSKETKKSTWGFEEDDGEPVYESNTESK